MEFFDSHAHYDDEQFDADRELLLGQMQEEGVRHIVNCASDLESAKATLRLAKQYDFIRAAVGVHPEHAAQFRPEDLDEIRRMATDEKVVAIGEIGLDYHYQPEEKELQKEIFRAQLALAKDLGLPAVIHCREADRDCFDIVKESGTFGVYHCYSGSVELMREILKLGYLIGFGGVVTFKNARKTVEAVRAVPKDRYLLETDCPYLSPEPLRGKRNSSLNLILTAQKIAEIRGESLEEVARQTTENAKRLFRME